MINLAAATVTVHNFPSDGSYIARGLTADMDDADTIDTGLVKVDGMMMTTDENDCVASLTSQSAGVANVALKTAGAAGSAVKVYWVAWQLPTST